MQPKSLVRRIIHFPLTRLFLGLIWVGGVAVGASLALQGIRKAAPGEAWLWSLIGAAVIVPAVWLAYLAYVHVLESRRVTEMSWPRALPEVLAGLLLGAGLFGASMAVLAALGCYRPDGTTPWLPVVAALAGACLSGVIEEIIFRGIIYRLLEEWLGSWLALFISAALFGLAHLANPAASIQSTVAIALEAGLLLGGAFVLTRRLWLPIGLHIGWNFCEGGIFGQSVSGGSANGWLRGSVEGPEWLTGGAFGVEASLVAVVICLTAGILMLWQAWRRGRLVPPSWRTRPNILPSVTPE
jgi:membrane protease YdiL (CAAX protease family)